MSENVRVAYGESAAETATLLLAAAEEKGYEPGVVTTGNGEFTAPSDVVKAAGLSAVKDEEFSSDEVGLEIEAERQKEAEAAQARRAAESFEAREGADSEKPAKKAAAPAKKAPAKKAAAKKSAAKK